ncbi:MAG: helix-turn-helix domain-containing protein [Burkholderiaceae bacterium]|nr:helix-turn-helix domain-containing protein [Burkholderiaceae bacterium]
MSTVRVKVDLSRPTTLPKGRIDRRKLDATTEADLAIQQAEDDAEAMQDAARFVRRVRRRLGLTQQEFARRIDVPLDTIRNWEQGKRYPTGAARSLLKVLDRVPKAALAALD